jgi:folate-binding Fe-S cluster repair protein YgfZ
MSHCHATLLPSRAVLKIGGADASKFLQGLIMNDIGKAEGAHGVHAGLLSPQGKVLFDFLIAADGDGFLVDVAREKAR